MEKNKRDWLPFIISWVLAGFFLVLYFIYIGFPPKYPADLMDWFYIAIALVFVVFPFIKKLRIGNLFEMETRSDVGKTPDNTHPTPISEIEKEIPSTDKNQDYLKSRMAYSVADENSREDISVDSLNWVYRSKDLFWLGQNLTYIKAVLISGGPKQLIMLALRQAYTHMKALGLRQSYSIRSIAALLYKFRNMTESEMDILKREKYAQILQECIYRIGRLSSDYQNKHLNDETES